MGHQKKEYNFPTTSRPLINYYIILIIDRVNKDHINEYGLDIRPLISRQEKKILATYQLIYKKDYLDNLGLLQDSY